ncbi:MAG: CAP domain-containing protein [Pyrinomonadaceae bacterium]
MYKRFFLIAILFAVLAITVAAQNNRFPTQTAIKLVGGGDSGNDPWGLLEDDEDAGVKASVVVNTAGSERQAFVLINKKRTESGLRQLLWSDELAVVARQHSQNMAEFRFFSHKGMDNKMVSDRADRAGVGTWRAIGENIAFNKGFADPIGRVVELWLNSPSHRHNMMDTNWTESAVGVAVATDGSYYFTQVFIVRR